VLKEGGAKGRRNKENTSFMTGDIKGRYMFENSETKTTNQLMESKKKVYCTVPRPRKNNTKEKAGGGMMSAEPAFPKRNQKGQPAG